VAFSETQTNSSPDKCGFNTKSTARFSRAIIVFLHRQYLVQTFRGDETSRSTAEYTHECLPIVPALSHTIKSLFYSSPANWLASALPVSDAVSLNYFELSIGTSSTTLNDLERF